MRKHGGGHEVAAGGGEAEGGEGLVGVFVDDGALDEAHGEDEERDVVARLGGRLEGGQVLARFGLGEVDAGQLILRIRVTGEGGTAQVICAGRGLT